MLVKVDPVGGVLVETCVERIHRALSFGAPASRQGEHAVISIRESVAS